MAAVLNWYKSAIGASVGGGRGLTAIVDATMNNVWSSLTDAQRIAGGNAVKKIFVANESGVDSWVSPVLWIGAQPAGCVAEIALGFDTADDANTDQLNMTAWAASAKVAALSSGADTRSLTIYGEVSGVQTSEVLVLNGATEVLSVATFSKVHAVRVSALDAARTVTLKQGTGGTTRGTIAASRIMSSRWQTVTSKAAGIRLPSLIPSAAYGVWERITWAAGVSGIDLTELIVMGEQA